MRKLLAILTLMVVVMMISATAAYAFDVRQNSNRLVIGATETIDDDMLLTADTIVIDGTINGDVMAFARSVTVNGTINGTLITAGTSVEVRGSVLGVLLVAGENLTVSGAVQRSMLSAGSRTTIDATARIGGSWLGAGDWVELRGQVARGAALAASRLYVKGKVGKELRAGGQDIHIETGAAIGGPFEYWSDGTALIEPGATTGAVTRHQPDTRWEQVSRPWFLKPGWIMLKFGGFLALGLLVLTVFPALRSRFPETLIAHPWQTPVAGFIALITIPIASIILMVTVIGLPIGLSSLLLLPLLIYVSQIFVSWTAARLLADQVPGLRDQSWPLLFLLGAILTTVLVEVPYLGGFAAFAFLIYGLGTMVYLVINRNRPTTTL